MFFEPIILTYFLIKSGFSNQYILNEYGILNGYVMPLILLPSFFTGAISQALLPIVSNGYANKFYKYTNMLLEWNEKINLTAITEISDIILKHYMLILIPCR